MTVDKAGTPPVRAGKSRTSLWAFVKARPGLTVGVSILLVLFAMSVLVGIIRPFSATEVAGIPFTGPNSINWLGTDELGRDYFVRVCEAARTSLTISVCAALLAMVVGSAIGLLAGLEGGKVDSILMGGIDLLVSLPSIIVALGVVAIFSPTTTTLVIVLAVVSVPNFARVVRSRCLELREREFIMSARVSGVSTFRIAVRHLLPNVLMVITVQLSNTAAIVILMESGLSYLGLGVQPPTPSWGKMIAESQSYMVEAPWLPLVPFVALLVTSCAWGLIGEGFGSKRKAAR
ncbi:ABC transporter permease [Rhodococcoides yunnanense]|uniref:ABC transporter permease n=1 Tax=Rhodococcoides yunnanense TaxID=278209 RepID=UPI000A073DB1|nr:ABC transporter permease [Rhodococcus yunnanensis]